MSNWNQQQSTTQQQTWGQQAKPQQQQWGQPSAQPSPYGQQQQYGMPPQQPNLYGQPSSYGQPQQQYAQPVYGQPTPYGQQQPQSLAYQQQFLQQQHNQPGQPYGKPPQPPVQQYIQQQYPGQPQTQQYPGYQQQQQLPQQSQWGQPSATPAAAASSSYKVPASEQKWAPQQQQQPGWGQAPAANNWQSGRANMSQMPQQPATGGPQTWTGGAQKPQFFSDVERGLNRDYFLVIDKSGSMSGSRWNDAREGIKVLAPQICTCDPDGATVYFFSSPGHIDRYDNISDANQVMQMFDRSQPGGTTDLAGALRRAFADHFNTSRQKPGYPPGHAPTTILIVTDGEPNDKEEVIRELLSASNRILADEELSVSFVQIGDDDSAMRFLKLLDDGLQAKGARFDIVDTMTKDRMAGMKFEEFIHRSIND